MSHSNALRVLFYHRVGDPDFEDADLAPEMISATPRAFERQVRHLARAYHPVRISEVLAALDGHRLPDRAVLVTFDDGYRDFLEVAWPILRRNHVPCALFISTAYVDDPNRSFWWDTVWQALVRSPSQADVRASWRTLTARFKKQSPTERGASVRELSEKAHLAARASRRVVLTWDELRLLAADGVAIGAHSRTHELLDQLGDSQLKWEIRGCRDDLAREFGETPPIFAYPNGNFSAEVCLVTSSAGYRLGFTTRPGLNERWTAQPLTLRRDGHSTSLLRFAFKLLGPVGRRRARRASLSIAG